MTKEISDIIAAYKSARDAGRKSALATVVYVEGSSYRRPGARMLVEETGQMTGAISGGCLEGDALRKALLAITQQQNKLVTYDTLSDDDIQVGVQLGCNGIVHILFEPVHPDQANNPINLLEKAISERRDAVIVTLFSLKNRYANQPGTCFFSDGESAFTNNLDEALEQEIMTDVRDVMEQKSSLVQAYGKGNWTGFVELVKPTISLVIAGAGNDALPLVGMAGILGWHLTLIDGRSTHASKKRFATVDKIIVGQPADALPMIEIDEQTAFLLMTHNYNYDLNMLRLLLQQKCRYIGTLGPKKRLERMFTELREEGMVITEQQENAVYGPTGLDIGAEASEEIALSVLAEIKAVMENRDGGFLRKRPASIHHDPTADKHASTL